MGKTRAATQEWENPELPLLVCVPIETGGNASLTDTEIYCVNLTSRTFEVAARNESFTTVDEETGAGIAHGSPPKTMVLAPGEAAQVGDVVAWEWDGAVGMNITYTPDGDGPPVFASFLLNWDRGPETLTIPSNGKTGRIATPSRIQFRGGPLVDDFQDVYSRSYKPLYGRAEPTDLPDGRTRLIEVQPRPDPKFTVPRILDRAERREVLNMFFLYADVTTKWRDGAISLSDRWSGMKLRIDIAGGRFRDEAAPEWEWLPLDALQGFVEAQLPRWQDVLSPEGRKKKGRARLRDFGIYVLAGVALLTFLLLVGFVALWVISWFAG